VNRLLVPGAVAVALLASGCTGGSSPSQDPPSASPTATATGTGSSTAQPAPPKPKRAACYRLTPAELTRPSNGSSPVPCRARHTARTIFVGRLGTVVDGHALAVDSDAVQRQLSRTCPRKLAAYVGGGPRIRNLSRFNVVWFSPSLEQSDAGADWFRCDLIAFDRQSSLYALPRAGGLQGVLGRRGALDTYGLCGTAAPGTRGFARVICARPHSWRAFTTIGLAGGRRYPGAGTVRADGDGACRARAHSRASNPLTFRYGWEWPTREQWAAGQHFGYCWVPA
jgi:hypothetical protein